MTHNVTVVHVPLIRHAPDFLQRVLRIMGTPLAFLGHQTGSLLTPAISQHGLLANGAPLQVVYANAGKGACRLPRGNASSHFCRHHSWGQAALQGTVDVSLLCTTILRHRWEPFLLNMGQAPMCLRCCCRVLGKEPRRRLAHRLPLDHPKAVFLVDFDSGQRAPE